MQPNKALHVALKSAQCHPGMLAGSANQGFFEKEYTYVGCIWQADDFRDVSCQKFIVTLFSSHRKSFASLNLSCNVLSIDAARVVQQPCQNHAILQRQYASSTCVTGTTKY